MTENTRNAFDDGNIGCEVFVDLQKAFDTEDLQILYYENRITMRFVESQMTGLNPICLTVVTMYL